MAFMDSGTSEEVRKRLAELPPGVKIVFFKEMLVCATCGPAEEFYRELAALGPGLTLEVYNQVTDAAKAAAYGVTRVPAAVVEGPNGARARFYGIPAGYELVSLLEALKNSAAPSQDLRPETLSALGALKAPVNIKVFVTPSCPYCPSAVALSQKFAMASPLVTAEMIESAEFPELADRYGVAGVPHIVVNEKDSLVGAQSEEALLKAVTGAAGG